MDAGDRSDNRLKAPDSSLVGNRSQSLSNILHGFFGVTRSSVHDIPSSVDYASEGGSKPAEGKSLETIISPSNDDSWILSRFLNVREENEAKFKRVATCPQSTGSTSSLCSLDSAHANDHSHGIQATTRGVGDGGLKHDVGGQTTDGSLGFSIGDTPIKPRTVVAKNVEQARRTRNLFSSFIAHDLPLREEKLETGETESLPNVDRTDAAASVTGSAIGEKKRRFPSGSLYWYELNMLASTNDQ